MGNKVQVDVDSIRTYKLVLSTSCSLVLSNTFYVPSLSRNLVSVSCLDQEGYYFKFGNGTFEMHKNNILIGFGILFDGLHKIHLDYSFSRSIFSLNLDTCVGIRRIHQNETSSMLWHKRRGHISKKD